MREEKGVSVLLEALRILDREKQSSVQCDLYGPIVPHYADRFRAELAQTPSASYQGVLDAEQVLTTMQQYDALVFPTYYQGEGQPGVVIESMMAGLPVIATHFRSVPEMVTDYINGLLIEPEHVGDLIQAILLLDHDRALLKRLGEQNWRQRVYHDASVIIPQLIPYFCATRA
ncbi:glycosyltransferase family 4 protein [Chloroflexi bacterium TSY]|nr:glycosyltransferase family 4 protein [Chloroflexi bacterium TSY]